MELDHFTVVLLELRPDAPQLDDTAANALQDAHLNAGRFSLRVLPWQVPAGAIAYTCTRFPHSIADVIG